MFNESGIWTVTEVNRAVARCLEANFSSLWVKGEIRGLTMATSGHWYFTLKDEYSEINCAMFAGANRRVGFRPKNGDHVEVRGKLSIYAPRGSYQLIVDVIRHEGLGALYARYLELKARLQTEGLFEASRKKRIRRVNFKIAVVTSLKAAALRDVIKTLQIRAPYVAITVFPTAVQGAEAPAEIVRALCQADQSDNQVILLVRGGGSLQDLWAFNDEQVARTLASMKTPVISGVGHESDETIVDYVADLRAATPTAAAQAATESVDVLYQDIRYRTEKLHHEFTYQLRVDCQRLQTLSQQIIHPRFRLLAQTERFQRQSQLLNTFFIQNQFDPKKRFLSELNQNLDQFVASQLDDRRQSWLYLTRSLISPKQKIEQCRHELEKNKNLFGQQWQSVLMNARIRLEQTVELMLESSPETILKKGYAYVSDEQGKLFKSFHQAKSARELNIHWLDGVVVTRPLKEKTDRANRKS